MSHATTTKAYLPAAGKDLFLPLYDPVTRLLGIARHRAALIEQAELGPGQRVLDLGCGTGSLLVALKSHYPAVHAVGIDPDPKALTRARTKAERAGVSLELLQGFGKALACPDASFDRVISSFALHHVKPSERLAVFREIWRVLKPGGRLELLDFGGPEGAHDSWWQRWLHAHHRLADNDPATLLGQMTQAGFADAHVHSSRRLLLSRFIYYQAVRQS